MSCENEAVALLSFSPQQAKAWLYDLHEADSTGGIALCRRHANATVVPMSWQLIDQRDPAWPGPSLATDESSEAEVSHDAMASTAADAATMPPADSDLVAVPARSEMATVGGPDDFMLPSDSAALDREFAALRDALPIAAQPYAEPRAATRRASGVRDGDLDPDLSLFELPLADVPAVTPHPGYS